MCQKRIALACACTLIVIACSTEPGVGDDDAPTEAPVATAPQTETDHAQPGPDDLDQSDPHPPHTSGDTTESQPYEGAPYDHPPYDREYDVAELYEAICVDCHGKHGDGQGSIDDGFSFATDADQWTNGPHIEGVLETLEDGIHNTAMREFPEYKDADRVELAEYILDLRQALRDDDSDGP